MKKSALQQARAAYQPKLPIVLTGAVKAVEGDPTQSVADQEDIKNLFPNTYGLPELKFEKNITLKFLSFAKDHELKISVKSEPMSFFETDVEAYIKRNGLLYPVSDLAPNIFYVYQNGDINQYSNSTLIFPNNEISTNLKSVFNDLKDAVNNPTLVGAHPKSS
jgi:hypothetical protein